MPIEIKNSGAVSAVKEVYTKGGGTQTPVQIGLFKQSGVWLEVYTASVTAVVSANTLNLDVSTLFTAEDWASPTKKKKVVIDTGVVVGSTNPALAALLTGNGFGSSLEVIVNGEVQGAGGYASGGAGGAAINVQASNVIVTNNGAIRGGGGGGGLGGAGGQGGGGYYYSTGTSNPHTQSCYHEDRGHNWYWYGSYIGNSGGAYTLSSGGYTYYHNGDAWGGSMQTSNGKTPTYVYWNNWYIYQTWQITNYTSGGAGGAGGAGGVGKGYGQTNADGVAGVGGVAGGTNAGAGGTGGTGGPGGDWATDGSPGVAGGAGSAGNNGAGAAGAAGGAGGTAGAAIEGTTPTITNNGTINGVTA